MDATADPIVIVGAGFAGLGMGIRLKQANIENFTILERGDQIGGTWRDNTYPGAACDVESHLYSYSFAPNPQWTRAFAPQKEILEYLARCADKFDIRRHIRLRTNVVGARFDAATGLYTLTTDESRVLYARALILCCGGLNRPVEPNIRGLRSFEGASFHSSRWNPEVPLSGKAVAVVGTGASAVQIVPAIASTVGRLDVYQRTPPWILPKPDRPLRAFERALFRVFPFVQRMARFGIYCFREAQALGFVVQPDVMKLTERVSRSYLRRAVADPALRARLTPNYRMGCKRILPTNDYYPSLCRPNVNLVTEPIAEVRSHSIVTSDGIERPTDAIILSTGFNAAEKIAPFEIFGSGPRSLDAQWEGGAEAFLGTTVSGFPNLFFIIGPNTGLGHNSMILMIESQVQYVLSCITTMRAQRLKSVDVTEAAQTRYNESIQARLKKTVWATGCSSWYMTPSGKNTTLWPGFTFEFRARTRRFDAGDYRVVFQDDADGSRPGPGVAAQGS